MTSWSGAAEFTGLAVIVTGGASGIGFATAAELVSRGARVAVPDREIAQVPDGSRGYRCDITDDDQVTRTIAEVAAEFGAIDIVVNNAGISAVGAVDDNDAVEWRRVLEVNVVAVARVTAAALPWLRRSSHPAVVNVSSIAANAGLPARVLYSASKGAVSAMTRAMAADHVAEGIRVNSVSPGTADTPWVERLLGAFEDPAAERAALDARQATGRLVRPAEVADAICYLASPLPVPRPGPSSRSTEA